MLLCGDLTLKKIAEYISESPKKVLFIVVIITVVMSFFAMQTEQETSFRSFFPDYPEMDQFNEINDDFGNSEIFILLFESKPENKAMLRKIGYAITSKPVFALLYKLIRIYSWTFKVKVVNEKDWIEYFENGGTVLICTWHQQFFPAIRYFKKYLKYNPSLMISKSKVGDFGVDGWLTNGEPVQIKQSKNIGRNVVDNFETAIRRQRKKAGMIVAFSFGKGANEEVARAKLEEGLEIRLKTVKDLLKEI